MTSIIQTLHDRLQIIDAVSRMAYAQDDRDWPALQSLLTTTIHFDISKHLSDHPAVTLSSSDMISKAQAALNGFTSTQHCVSNILVTDLDSEAGTAKCRAMIVAYHYLETEPGMQNYCTMRGHWDMRLRKSGKRWLFERIVVVRTSPLEGNSWLYKVAAAQGAEAGSLG